MAGVQKNKRRECEEQRAVGDNRSPSLPLKTILLESLKVTKNTGFCSLE